MHHGTKGEFEIILITNEKIKYEIKFENKNQKPENLVFKIDGKDKKYKELKDMENDLKGEIEENKIIKIIWEWNYESGSKQDMQDTKDGSDVKMYNFLIYAIGEE